MLTILAYYIKDYNPNIDDNLYFMRVVTPSK